MMMLLQCPYPVESRTPRVWSWTSRLAVVVASIAAACLVIRWPQASLAVPASAAANTPGNRFQVAYFVAEPHHEPSGVERTIIYSMPVALPPDFDLEVEVRSPMADLSQVRIAGQPLGTAGAANPSHQGVRSPLVSEANGDTSWHRVHLHSVRRRVSVTVDGRIVSDARRNGPAADWLTVEPPAHASAEFRNLDVRW